jgi:2,3-bisphosphoglycerate-independent phosphoglycerate mutase
VFRREKVKYVLLICDGMADYPLEKLQGKTPLQVAKTPNLDRLARDGSTGLAVTIPENMSPGSDVASLSILGYDPAEYYRGRGPLEAVSLDIEPAPDDLIFRCNLVSVADGLMQDYSAGHISTKEAKVLIDSLNDKIDIDGVSFYPGVSYRHVTTIKESLLQEGKGELRCVPPHAFIGRPIEPNLPTGRGSPLLRRLMESSPEILSVEPINQVKIDLGENPANMIWLWGGGKLERPPSFREKFGVEGTVIAAVDLIKGIGKLIGLQAPSVPGATGYYDTDYDAKASSAVDALQGADFVVVHVEAADEAGHNADILQKITAIERFDAKIVGRMMERLEQWGEYRVVVLPDHYTPISVRNHTPEPVPFAIAGKGIPADRVQVFDELSVAEGGWGRVRGHQLMSKLFAVEG